jgi:hypothetical protein
VSNVAGEYGEEFNNLRTETMEQIKQNSSQFDNWTDPDAVKSFVEYNFLRAHRAAVAKAASAPETPRGEVPSVPKGTPGRAPKVTAEDQIADEIVNAFMSERYE